MVDSHSSTKRCIGSYSKCFFRDSKIKGNPNLIIVGLWCCWKRLFIWLYGVRVLVCASAEIGRIPIQSLLYYNIIFYWKAFSPTSTTDSNTNNIIPNHSAVLILLWFVTRRFFASASCASWVSTAAMRTTDILGMVQQMLLHDLVALVIHLLLLPNRRLIQWLVGQFWFWV